MHKVIWMIVYLFFGDLRNYWPLVYFVYFVHIIIQSKEKKLLNCTAMKTITHPIVKGSALGDPFRLVDFEIFKFVDTLGCIGQVN